MYLPMKNLFLFSLSFVFALLFSVNPSQAQNRQLIRIPQGQIVHIHPQQDTIKHPQTKKVLYTRNITPARDFNHKNDWRYASQKNKNRPDLAVATRYSRFNRQMYDRFGHPRFTYLFDNDFDAGTYQDHYFYGENHAHLRGKSVLDYTPHTHLPHYRIIRSHP